MNYEKLTGLFEGYMNLKNFPMNLFAVFSTILVYIILKSKGLFTKKFGRKHRICGLLYLLALLLCYIETFYEEHSSSHLILLLSHLYLGLMGIVLTLTAAFEFQHKNIKNIASGTLDEHATVTYSEMIEHSFYQFLNLIQIIYLHFMELDLSFLMRIVFLFAATSPWLFRNWFPVNKFSDNYQKPNNQSTDLIKILYRIKKYQYVFYKHFLLHGLNISVAIYSYKLVKKKSFKIYWILLNTSYTMEFFLQTLVKKKYLAQETMIVLQKLLMTASSISAVYILSHTDLFVAFLSTILNFLNRKNDVINTFLVILLVIYIKFNQII